MAQDDIFSNLEEGSFDGITIPVVNVQMSTGSAAAFHKYPYRPGVDIEYTGREPLSGSITAAYFNDIDADEETGLLWPDTLFSLRQRIQEQRSGKLVLPTFGTIDNARLTMSETYDADRRDGCFVRLDFVEDSREVLAQKQIATPSALSRMTAAALEADNALADLAIDPDEDESMRGKIGATLRGFASAVSIVQTTILLNQDDLARPILQASVVVQKCQDLLNTVTALRDPNNWAAVEALRDLSSSTFDVMEQLTNSSKSLKRYTTAKRMTIGEVATSTGNSVDDLLRLNVIENANNIDPNTELYIYG